MPEGNLGKLDKAVLSTVLNLPELKSVLDDMGKHFKKLGVDAKISGKDVVNAYQNVMYLESHFSDEMLKLGGILERMYPDVRDQANAMNKMYDASNRLLRGYIKDAASAEAASSRLETAKKVWGGIAEAASAAGIQLKLTIGTIVSGIIAVSEATGAARGTRYGAAPGGVYGVYTPQSMASETDKLTNHLIYLGYSAKEAAEFLKQSSRAGSRTGDTYQQDVLSRVRAAKDAEITHHLTTQTADSFYKNVEIRIGRSSKDASALLDFFSKRMRETGVSVETQTSIFNALAESSGGLGARMEDLSRISGMYAKDIQEGRMSLQDLSKSTSDLTEAPLGKMIGRVMLAKQLGVELPKGLQGKGPLEIPEAILSGEVKGPELFNMERELVKRIAGMSTAPRGLAEIIAAQEIFGIGTRPAYEMAHPEYIKAPKAEEQFDLRTQDELAKDIARRSRGLAGMIGTQIKLGYSEVGQFMAGTIPENIAREAAQSRYTPVQNSINFDVNVSGMSKQQVMDAVDTRLEELVNKGQLSK